MNEGLTYTVEHILKGLTLLAIDTLMESLEDMFK